MVSSKPPLRSKRGQRNFTFSKRYLKDYPKHYLPIGHFTVQDEFRTSLLRQGYLIKDLVVEEVIQVRCVAARANLPLAERQRLQNKIDAAPPQSTFPRKN